MYKRGEREIISSPLSPPAALVFLYIRERKGGVFFLPEMESVELRDSDAAPLTDKNRLQYTVRSWEML